MYHMVYFIKNPGVSLAGVLAHDLLPLNCRNKGSFQTDNLKKGSG